MRNCGALDSSIWLLWGSAETWLDQCFYTAGLRFVHQVTFSHKFCSHFRFYFEIYISLLLHPLWGLILHANKSLTGQEVQHELFEKLGVSQLATTSFDSLQLSFSTARWLEICLRWSVNISSESRALLSQALLKRTERSWNVWTAESHVSHASF